MTARLSKRAGQAERLAVGRATRTPGRDRRPCAPCGAGRSRPGRCRGRTDSAQCRAAGPATGGAEPSGAAPVARPCRADQPAIVVRLLPTDLQRATANRFATSRLKQLIYCQAHATSRSFSLPYGVQRNNPAARQELRDQVLAVGSPVRHRRPPARQARRLRPRRPVPRRLPRQPAHAFRRRAVVE